MSDQEDFRVGWVARHTGRKLTAFQASAVVLLCEAMRCGPYDFSGTFRRANWEYGKGVRFVVRGGMATYDTDGLTALVLGAHDRAIRVEVRGAAPGYVAIEMHPRAREHEGQWGRHPSIEQVLERREELAARAPARCNGHRSVKPGRWPTEKP